MKRKSLVNSSIQFINTYSILVALGSFSSYLFFSKIYKVEPNYVVATGLALGVWFIYTLDHLFDGLQLKDKAFSKRHIEHFQKQNSIKVLLGIVAFILVLLAVYVPKNYYSTVVLLVGLTALHFIINYLVPTQIKKRIFLKEVFIAFVVSLGLVATPYHEVAYSKIIIEATPIFYVFFFINLANLILFSMYDKEVDEKSGTLSIAGFYSPTILKRLILLCLLVSFLLVVINFQRLELNVLVFLIFLGMQITLSIICLLPGYFSLNDRYRFYGDLIYLYPLLALPFL